MPILLAMGGTKFGNLTNSHLETTNEAKPLATAEPKSIIHWGKSICSIYFDPPENAGRARI